MRCAIFSLLINILLPLSLWATPSQDIQFQEIQKWVLEQRPSKGSLLNPPKGKTSKEIQNAIGYISEMVRVLGGDNLKSKNIIIHLYASTSPNAWVHELGVSWPLSPHLGFNNGNSVFEIGITTGMLNTLKYQDELAFILGHELTHLLEGHTHAEKGKEFGKWWSSQSHEVVADLGGIEKMTGFYELDGALIAMSRILKQDEKNSKPLDTEATIRQAAQVAAGSHHPQGLRISTLQYYIEKQRRSSILATKKNLQSLPRFHFHTPVVQKTYDPVIQQRIKQEIEELLKTDLIFELTGSDNEKKEITIKNSPELSLLNSIEANTVEEILHILNTTEATSQKKMDVLLGLLLLGQTGSSSQVSDSIFDKGNERLFIELRRFLYTNSQAWDSRQFLNKISILQNLAERKWENWRFFTEKMILFDVRLSEVFHTLAQKYPTWKNLIDKTFDYSIETDLSISGITNRLGAIYLRYKKDALIHPFYKNNFIRTVQKIPPVQLVQESEDHVLQSSPIIDKLFGVESEIIFGDDVNDFKRSWLDFISLHKKKMFEILENKTINERIKALNMVRGLPLGTNLLTPYEEQRLINYRIQELKSDLSTTIFNRGRVAYLQQALINPRLSESDKWLYLQGCIYESYALSDRLSRKEKTDINIKLSYEFIKNKDRLYLWNEIFNNSSFLQKLEDQSFQIMEKNNLNAKNILSGMSKMSDEESKLLDEGIQAQKSLFNYRLYLMTALIKLYPQWTRESLTSSQLKYFLTLIERDSYIGRIQEIFSNQNFPVEVSNFMMETLAQRIQSTATDFSLEEWFHTYKRIKKLAGAGFLVPENSLLIFRQFLTKQLQTISTEKIEKLADKKSIWSIFENEQIADIFANRFVRESKSMRSNPKELGLHFHSFTDKTGLLKNRPDLVFIIRNKIAEKTKLQPDELKTTNLEDPRTETEKANGLASEIRGLGALVTVIRAQSGVEQLNLLEYLLGRKSQLPQVILDIQKEINSNQLVENLNVEALFRYIRGEMAYRNPLERAFLVNSVLAGPNSIIEKTNGLKLIVDHVLSKVSDTNRPLAHEITYALIEAEGINKSFILSYILAQKTENESELSETLVLKSLLDAYGAPGVKLAQYLAFSNEFKNFQSVLEVYQDAAMPISYYEAIKLLESRMGKSWNPSRYQVNKIIGSGSVNIAIELTDKFLKKPMVVSILREHIEAKTQEDFRRFGLLISSLTKDPIRKSKYEFVIGLLDIIKKSVTLEFSKENAFNMQKTAETLYQRNIRGWQVKTVKVENFTESALFMEKAAGQSARKILKNNPEAYQSAMSALLDIEFEAMRGVFGDGKFSPVPLFANPDLHDGQVLIDIATKEVTILDFGQAIAISNVERNLAIDILRIITIAESTAASAKLLTSWSEITGKKVFFSEAELTTVLSKKERMDIFVHLLSLAERKNFKIPLSTVHWVLAANRIMILGQKTNSPIEGSMKALILSKKLGLPLSFYNLTRLIKDKAISGFRAVFPSVSNFAKIRCEFVLGPTL